MASVGILVLVQTAGLSLVQTVVGTPSCYGKKAPHGMLNTVSKRLYYAGTNRYPRVHAINVPPPLYPPTPTKNLFGPEVLPMIRLSWGLTSWKVRIRCAWPRVPFQRGKGEGLEGGGSQGKPGEGPGVGDSQRCWGCPEQSYKEWI